MGRSAGRLRQIYQDISSSHNVTTATTTTTEVSGKTNDTIYIQSWRVRITTGSPGVTWTLRDDNGTPVPISGTLDASAANVDYTSPEMPAGQALTVSQGLVLAISAAGAAGHVEWTGYRKRTTVAAA